MSEPHKKSLAESFNKQRILITGGAGFIGSHLVDFLCPLAEKVTVFDNFATGSLSNLGLSKSFKSLNVIHGDVRNLNEISKAIEGHDTVFHLATNCVRLSLSDPQTNHEVNATGTLNTLMASKKANIKRFIYCSSSEIYGNSTYTNLLSEDSLKSPSTVYGASKLVGEHYTMAYNDTYGLRAMVIRPFNAYGPRSHVAGPFGELIPRFTTWIRANKEALIFGDGLQTRDFTFVEDTARWMALASLKDELLGNSLNLACGQDLSVNQIAEILFRLHNKVLKVIYVPDRPGDIRKLACDNRKMKSIFPDLTPVSIEDGLKKYLHWLDTQNLNFQKIAEDIVEKNWLQIS